MNRSRVFGSLLATGALFISSPAIAAAETGSSSGSADIPVIGPPIADFINGVTNFLPSGSAQIVRNPLGFGSSVLGALATGSILGLQGEDGGGAIVTQNCNTSTQSGGYGDTTTNHRLGRSGPTSFTFTYDTIDIPDKIFIYYEGKTLWSVGPVGTNGYQSVRINVPPGSAATVSVRVIGDDTGTQWDYVVNCPY